MKLAQLFESPKDEIKLQEIAQAVVRYVQDKVAQGIQEQYVELKLSDLPKGTLGHLYSRLRAVEIAVLFRSAGNIGGEYSQWGRSIRMYTRLVADHQTGSTKLGDPNQLQSDLIHELRHALDHSLRKRLKFDDRQEYLQRPHEINARFSEVQAELVNALKQSIANGKTMTLREFINHFEGIAVKYKLIQIFDQDDQVINAFADFVENGVFGRPVGTAVSKIGANSINNRPDNADIGAFGDKRYRSLIRRLSTLYYHIVESETKKAPR